MGIKLQNTPLRLLFGAPLKHRVYETIITLSDRYVIVFTSVDNYHTVVCTSGRMLFR